jgi:hypothetical protein
VHLSKYKSPSFCFFLQLITIIFYLQKSNSPSPSLVEIPATHRHYSSSPQWLALDISALRVSSSYKTPRHSHQTKATPIPKGYPMHNPIDISRQQFCFMRFSHTPIFFFHQIRSFRRPNLRPFYSPPTPFAQTKNLSFTRKYHQTLTHTVHLLHTVHQSQSPPCNRCFVDQTRARE